MSTGWEAPISDDAAKLLERLMAEHGPRKGGWCRCGQVLAWCRRQAEFEVQLAIADRLPKPRPAPWVVQAEEGSWRDQG